MRADGYSYLPSQEDQKVISEAIFEWARERGAIDFAHWFFPLRGSLA